MSEPKWLRTIPSENLIDETGENVFTLVTDDNHLLLEIDLNEQVAWTESKNRRIGSISNTQVRMLTKTGSRLKPRFWISCTIWKKRVCEHCKEPMLPTDINTHDEDLDVHEWCYPAWIKKHPEYKEDLSAEDYEPVFEGER